MFASLVAIFPGFARRSAAEQRRPAGRSLALKYTTIAAVAIGVAMLAGIIFYWLGGSTRAKMVEIPLEGDEELALAAVAVAPA